MPDQFSVSQLPERLIAAVSFAGDPALALVQGYPETRLIEASKAATLVRPPNTWEDFFDLRVFGPAGEWHAWNCGGNQWAARFWKSADHEQSSLLHRELPLWGNNIKERQEGWVLLSEANGAAVWAPESVDHASNGGRNRPLAILRVVEIVGYEERSGLAGIVDCALRAVEPNPHAA